MLNFNCKERAVMGHLGCFNFSLKILSWKTTGFVYENNCLVKLNVKQIFFAFNVANNISRVTSGFRVTAMAEGHF